jgi:hypothetical protein
LQEYINPSPGREKGVPPSRDRHLHAQKLLASLKLALETADGKMAVSQSTSAGIYLEFEGEPGFPLRVQSLENRVQGVKLLNIRTRLTGDQETQLATVFVPSKKRAFFSKKISSYGSEDTKPDSEGKVKPANERLVASINDIRGVILDSFWTDDSDLMPKESPRWIEIWLSTTSDSDIETIRAKLAVLGLKEGARHPVLKFPERSVILALASRPMLLSLLDSSEYVAEFKAAREPITYFLDIANSDQSDHVSDLLDRLVCDDSAGVRVCLLDTGVNSGHPLIAPILSQSDCQAIDPSWGTHDHCRHGTKMAGIATYGDLQDALTTASAVTVRHKLESVKIVPPHDGNHEDLWGDVTAQGIYLAEIEGPGRKRIICLAITAPCKSDRGRPTSWSAKLDQLASGVGDETKRLILVSAGNVRDEDWAAYPNSNHTSDIHDPAQAWNALSVGAFTNKVQISHPDFFNYSPIAVAGTLSPTSSTSCTWTHNKWPIKPEVVFEGGNIAKDLNGDPAEIDDLLVLSTRRDFQLNQFAPFGSTSAAVAKAAQFAAGVLCEYPDLWPETVRGLTVHSADWTEGMKGHFPCKNKGDYEHLLRTYGYGVPDIDLALHCLKNRLTLVSESALQPFRKKGTTYSSNELQLYELPWPVEALQELGAAKVTMRVTLSYFIEPSPGEKGWDRRYGYASHGLRFDVNNAVETKEEFVKRINKAARDEEEKAPNTPSAYSHWLLGDQRNVGSVHSDVWTGTGAQLASSNMIAVRPSVGWWSERPHLGRWDRSARYSLIVSIHTPTQSVDVYTPVLQAVTQPIPIQVESSF